MRLEDFHILFGCVTRAALESVGGVGTALCAQISAKGR